MAIFLQEFFQAWAFSVLLLHSIVNEESIAHSILQHSWEMA